VNSNRPINKNPLTMRLPLAALVSISHRLSGLFVFLMIPGFLWLLDQSLQSADSFENIKVYFEGLGFRVAVWLFLAALVFHWVAGIRHLLMDAGIGESLKGGRRSAFLVFLLSIVLFVCIGMWLWQ
jgi:succinate dehydrogenase / fumarate reductase, cytochrome b subunit